MKILSTLLATTTLVLAASSVTAQTTENAQSSRQQERINSILGALFGDRSGSTNSIEAQWAAGRTPLATQRIQFNSRVDSDVRTGAIDQRTAVRLKEDYAELVQLEAEYGADRRFSPQERADLAGRYNALTQVLANQSYGDSDVAQAASVADGQAEFVTRVNASVLARRLSRTAGTRLKADYALLVQAEATYLRDGTLSERERDDLDSRLDALDERVGDTAYSGNTTKLTPRARLSGIANAISSSSLSSLAQAQLRVEHGDLSYLEAAYARLAMTADDRNYLENRLSDLERRLQIRTR